MGQNPSGDNRGGKSSTLCRIAVLEALFGEHTIPPGDVGVAAFVSVSRDEAGQRLRTIRAILDALRVKHRPVDGGIELASRPIVFKVYAASVAGVSGFTCVAAIADEVAKWRDADTNANPASEVLASLRPTMATQPSARMFLSSSPLGPDDAHATAFDEGETSFQSVGYAPSWEANPSVSEAESHRLEPDERKWAREYLAVPQAGTLAAFDSRLIDYATRIQIPSDWSASEKIILVDPSAGGSDAFTWCAVGWRRSADGQTLLEFSDVDGISDAAGKGVSSADVIRRIASLGRRLGITTIRADQFERYALQSAFARAGFSYHPHSWTQQTKERAVEHVRGWLRDKMLCLPQHEKLKSELCAFEERVSPSGALTFKGRGATHDDFAMLTLLAALVDIEVGLSGSPSGHRVAGQGVLEWYEMRFAALTGGPSPLIIAGTPEEPVSLAAPARMAGCSTFSDIRGTVYPLENGRIRAKPECVEDLRRFGFTHAE